MTFVISVILMASLGFSPVAKASAPKCATEFIVPTSGSEMRRKIVDQAVEEALPDTVSIFSRISRAYVADEVEYVLVGRSPSVMAAFLEAQKEIDPTLRSWILPLSLREIGEVPASQLQKRFEQVFSMYRAQAGWTDFDRKLVFIDFVRDGRTFEVLDRLLRPMNIRAEFAGYAPDPSTINDILYHKVRHHDFRVVAASERVSWTIGLHKVTAPYESYSIGAANFQDAAIAEVKKPNQVFDWAVEKVRQELGLN